MKFARFMMLGVLAGLLMGVSMVLAGPPAQDTGIFPTPTPVPIDEPEYELTVVGGEETTFVFPAYTDDETGVSLSETTIIPQYPRGMIFEVRIDAALDIQAVTLNLRYDGNSGLRGNAEYDEERDVWSTHLWATGDGQPPWVHFRAFWRVTTVDNVTTTSPDMEDIDYYDPTREWYRVETPHIVVYWFGSGDIDPDSIARDIAIAMAATEPRRIAGFGRALTYKPRGVLFPTREAFAEMYGNGITNSNVGGFTSSDLGTTVNLFSPPAEDWYERQAQCIYLTSSVDNPPPLERRLQNAIYGTIPHEVTHLYQFENGGAVGGVWWSEGQAEFFTYGAGSFENRLVNLAELDPDIWQLQEAPVQNFEADGCYALAYDMGPSFISFLFNRYGGIEAHLEIVELYSTGTVSVPEAIEQVTGKAFFDLENEWRIAIGFAPLDIADVDPASALEPAPDAPFQAGDTATVAGFTPVGLLEAPGSLLTNAPCFGGTEVDILRVGTLNGTDYYEVDCQGVVGWLTIEALQE